MTFAISRSTRNAGITAATLFPEIMGGAECSRTEQTYDSRSAVGSLAAGLYYSRPMATTSVAFRSLLKGIGSLALLVLSGCNLQDESLTNVDDATTAPRAIAEALRAGSHTPVNLLQNASFEQLDRSLRPKYWIAPETPLIATDPAKARNGSVAVGGTPTSYFSTVVNIAGGKRYTLGHHSRSDAPAAARLQINWLTADGEEVPSIRVVSTRPEWRWHTLTATAPPDASKGVIYLAPHAQHEVWFDDVWFGEGASAPATDQPAPR